MDMQKRLEIFETMSIPKAAALLAIPTMLSNLVSILYNLADTYFVGMLGDPVQNAGVTLAGPVMLAFNAVNNLFGVGCSSQMARSLGRKDYEAVRHTSAFGFYSSLLAAVCFSLLCTAFKPGLLDALGVDGITWDACDRYMLWSVSWGAAPAILCVVLSFMVRSEGAAMHASIGTISGCLLNIVLDPFFVLPQFLGLGAEGAGLATFISNCVACLYFVILIISRKKHDNTFISLSPADFTIKRSICSGVFAVGIPSAIQNLLNVTGMTILNNYASGFGAVAVAAMGIGSKIHNVPIQIAMGSASGIMPLISYNWSSGNYRRLKDCFTFMRRILMVFLCTLTLVFLFFADPLVAAFMDIPEVVEAGAYFLRVLGLGLPLVVLDFMAVGVFNAIGLGRAALIFAIMRKVVLEIPLIIILNRLFPLWGLPFSHVITELVLAVVATVTVRNILKKKGV